MQLLEASKRGHKHLGFLYTGVKAVQNFADISGRFPKIKQTNYL